MKALMVAGIVLLVLGIIFLVNEGISYRDREKVLDLGPIEAHKDVRKTIPMSPLFAGLLVAGGATLLVIGAKRA
jgi:hypothetical protein